jgi:hypothetical protein
LHPHSQGQEVGDSWVVARETDHGGHSGFDVPYGRDHLDRVLRLLLDAAVLSEWLAVGTRS